MCNHLQNDEFYKLKITEQIYLNFICKSFKIFWSNFLIDHFQAKFSSFKSQYILKFFK